MEASEIFYNLLKIEWKATFLRFKNLSMPVRIIKVNGN